MGLKIGGKVEKVNGREVSYGEFMEKYMAQNQPVVLTGLMDDWRACNDWVSPNGKPNLHFFSSHFGKSKIQVADCGTREFTDQKRIEMTVSEFVDHWLCLSSANNGGNSDSGAAARSLLYLKDWHFVKEYPEYIAYRTPLDFSDDWLNFYLDKFRMHNDPDTYSEGNEISCSDYRFVYMGAKGTWTPLHADVFRSYSWSANVCGKKQWYFLPPSQHHLVFDRNMKSTVYNIFADVSQSKFPGFEKAIWWECTQEENEVIFVPSGWYHQVHNLEDTISINHNWFNGYNLSWVWDLLLKDYNEASEYIEDLKGCDDFEELCQRNLAANTGMNFYDFFIFIVRFAFANVVLLHKLAHGKKEPNQKSSEIIRHIYFNLESIRSVAVKMKPIDAGDRQGVLLDLKKNLEEHSFIELCAAVGKTYELIHEQSEVTQALSQCKDLTFSSLIRSQVQSSEDLVTFIDDALTKLGAAFSG
ncbi:arginine-specific demethylase JMJ20 [Nicotiana tabacum]|uniref:Arginine-specific demethylase JMJ20 n=1 Tax=Nicotiana tabacum TaxID=4097 RepID=A0A1S4BTB1_TOBAC|nr:2-oxoglutarate and iron-dependent oxygenase JMJD4 [Nicotiana tomentosiformis]XP_016492033.1 PREDICTED: jmjC domain-containing protein 4-like [Nicotiana tabacum]